MNERSVFGVAVLVLCAAVRAVSAQELRTMTVGAVLSAKQYGTAFEEAVEEANAGEGACHSQTAVREQRSVISCRCSARCRYCS